MHHTRIASRPLFKPGLPVVLEGHWDAEQAVFDSDRILVKHTAELQEGQPRTASASDKP